jgi:MFS family permease
VGSFGRYVLSLSAIVLVVVFGLAGLAQLKFSAFLSDSIGERMEVVGATAAQDLGTAIDLGLGIDEVANGPDILRRARSHDPDISGVAVVDLGGSVMHSVGSSARDIRPETREAVRLAHTGVAEPTWVIEVDDQVRSGVLIEGSFGQPVGGVVVHYPTTEMRQQEGEMAGRLLFDALWVAALMVLIVVAMVLLMHQRRAPDIDAQRFQRRVVAGISLVLVVGVVGLGTLIIEDFNRALEPELGRRASLIGETVRDDTERALDLGIPLEGLVGTDEYFDVLLADFPELDYLALRSGDDAVVHASGEIPARALDPDVSIAWVGRTELGDSLVSRFALVADQLVVGSLDVGVDSGFVRSKLEDLALDIAVILIVALLAAYELTLVVSRRIGRPDPGNSSEQRFRGAPDIRLVLFLFVVGEELSKSFLPQFILASDNPFPPLDPAVAVSLPIMAYLLTLAIVSPFADRLAEAFGHRGLFLMGIGAAALSNLGMVFATDLVQIIGLRALTGVGYAFATIACFEYLLERMPESSRVRTAGIFVTVVIAGTFAGTALGGILADRLGYQAVFAISFAIVVIAGLLAFRIMRPGRSNVTSEAASFSWQEMRAVLRQPRLVALLAGVTIPMNVLMAAFLWYLVPLTLAAAGSGAAAIARTLMLYYLVVLIGAPLVARLSERHLQSWALAGLGSVASGAVLLVPAAAATTLTITLALLIVGLGHAAIRGPQIALALDIAGAETDGGGRGATLAAMRSLERLGSLVGLLFVALLAARFDLPVAMGVIGLVVALAGLAFLLSHPVLERRSAHA